MLSLVNNAVSSFQVKSLYENDNKYQIKDDIKNTS